MHGNPSTPALHLFQCVKFSLCILKYKLHDGFQAHSTASILSLQGKAPLPGYPKTLRDFTHASELLTLPSSFGSIQLGETFSSCLSINSESHLEIDAVRMRVEMQTATAKVLLAEFGSLDHKIAAKDTFECLINHEIKELGQHVLACSVTYRFPLNARQPSAPAENTDDHTLQTFRKFYKFVVSLFLLLSVDTRAPS